MKQKQILLVSMRMKVQWVKDLTQWVKDQALP